MPKEKKKLFSFTQAFSCCRRQKRYEKDDCLVTPPYSFSPPECNKEKLAVSESELNKALAKIVRENNCNDCGDINLPCDPGSDMKDNEQESKDRENSSSKVEYNHSHEEIAVQTEYDVVVAEVVHDENDVVIEGKLKRNDNTKVASKSGSKSTSGSFSKDHSKDSNKASLKKRKAVCTRWQSSSSSESSDELGTFFCAIPFESSSSEALGKPFFKILNGIANASGDQGCVKLMCDGNENQKPVKEQKECKSNHHSEKRAEIVAEDKSESVPPSSGEQAKLSLLRMPEEPSRPKVKSWLESLDFSQVPEADDLTLIDAMDDMLFGVKTKKVYSKKPPFANTYYNTEDRIGSPSENTFRRIKINSKYHSHAQHKNKSKKRPPKVKSIITETIQERPLYPFVGEKVCCGAPCATKEEKFDHALENDAKESSIDYLPPLAHETTDHTDVKMILDECPNNSKKTFDKFKLDHDGKQNSSSAPTFITQLFVTDAHDDYIDDIAPSINLNKNENSIKEDGQLLNEEILQNNFITIEVQKTHDEKFGSKQEMPDEPDCIVTFQYICPPRIYNDMEKSLDDAFLPETEASNDYMHVSISHDVKNIDITEQSIWWEFPNDAINFVEEETIPLEGIKQVEFDLDDETNSCSEMKVYPKTPYKLSPEEPNNSYKEYLEFENAIRQNEFDHYFRTIVGNSNEIHKEIEMDGIGENISINKENLVKSDGQAIHSTTALSETIDLIDPEQKIAGDSTMDAIEPEGPVNKGKKSEAIETFLPDTVPTSTSKHLSGAEASEIVSKPIADTGHLVFNKSEAN